MKKYALLPVFLLMISTITAQQFNDKMQAFFDEMEGKSFVELEASLGEGIQGMEMFLSFIDPANDEKPRVVAQEDIRYDTPFKIDSSQVDLALKQFDRIGFYESFASQKVQLKFEKIGDRYWKPISTPEGIKDDLVPTKIFYHDGAILTKDVASKKVSFFFDEDWGAAKLIDSVEVVYRMSYPSAVDSLKVRLDKKRTKFQGGVVTVKKHEHNFVYITTPDAISEHVVVKGFDDEGNILNSPSSSYSPMAVDEGAFFGREVLEFLKDLKNKLSTKTFKDAEALQEYLGKKSPQFVEKADTDGVFHQQFYFDGMPAYLKLYIPTKMTQREVRFIAKPALEVGAVILMQEGQEILFMDKALKERFRIPTCELEQLNDRYYRINEDYFHLNLTENRLVKMDAVNVFGPYNDCTFVQKTLEGGFVMMDEDLNPIHSMAFDFIEVLAEDLMLGLDLDQTMFLINRTGEIKKLEGLRRASNPSNGRLLVKDIITGSFGFINFQGDLVVPAIYTEADDFNEGLAIVGNKEGLVGFVDLNGAVVIDFKYYTAKPFVNGVALVEGEEYYLIDTNGVILVHGGKGGYSISGNGNDRTYNFGEHTYDSFGKLLPTRQH